MKLKNIIKITLFVVVSFVLRMVISSVISALGTLGIFISTSLGSLIIAPIVMVMCHQVKTRGTMAVFYLLNGLIFSLMGFWPMLVVFSIAAIVGELIIGKSENYSNSNRIGLSYTVAEFIYSLHGYMFFSYFGVNKLVKQFPSMFTLESAQWMRDFIFGTRNMIIILGLQLALTVIGVYFAKYIYNRFFAKHTEPTILK